MRPFFSAYLFSALLGLALAGCGYGAYEILPCIENADCGACNECSAGACRPIEDGIACGECRECRAGACANVTDFESCGGSRVCRGGACCDPDCSGRTCGPDPVCGASCGPACASGPGCTAEGTCPIPCSAGCPPCQRCNDATDMCEPDPGADCGATGSCLRGSCCETCVADRELCVEMTSHGACGQNGDACAPCGVCTECDGGACVPRAGVCEMAGAVGQCRGDDCCTGCWTGSACLAVAAQTRIACGRGGAMCDECPPCQVCRDGTCVANRELDRLECPGGRCADGACCERCLTDGPSPACGTGTSNVSCGRMGADCQNCEASGRLCVEGMCLE
jgi:hypothetical protein